jgi:hypothetical protein
VTSRSSDNAELGRFRLPVSGRMVALRPPSGEEDLLLAEAARTARGDAELAVVLAERLAGAVDGEPLDWGSLAITDLDATVLRLRQALLGDRIRSDIGCQAPTCGTRIDIDFGIEDFLAHHAPQAENWTLAAAEEPGWFWLAESEPDRVGFRVPTVADLLAVAGDPAAADLLASRCVKPAQLPERLRLRVEDAMEAIAPSLTGDLQGVCPECGNTVSVQFDARWFCLRELRDRAAFIYQDVDLLARRYHWSEADILTMPHTRRAVYAELARQEERA